MGAGYRGNFGKTKGSKKISDYKIEIINKINDNKNVVIPNSISQIDHIFRKDSGHFEFSENNVKKISKLINDEKNIVLREDVNGNTWYAKINRNGSQVWGKVHNSRLSDGGINKIPRIIDKMTGFDKNPFNNRGGS